MNRVEEIIKYEKAAEDADVFIEESYSAIKDTDSYRSKYRWYAAKLIWEELQGGKSQRQLARDIGKDRSHVRWMSGCHKVRVLKYPNDTDLPPFNTVYNSEEVRGTSDSAEAVLMMWVHEVLLRTKPEIHRILDTMELKRYISKPEVQEMRPVIIELRDHLQVVIEKMDEYRIPDTDNPKEENLGLETDCN